MKLSIFIKMNLFIIYPRLFSCTAKFNRKVTSILSGSTPKKIYTLHDDKCLISEYFSGLDIIKIRRDDIKASDVTHGIIFDNGEYFHEEYKQLKLENIPVRRLKIKVTKVINIKMDEEYRSKKDDKGYEYIGRGSKWGNPYSVIEEGSREEAIRKFKYDFDRDGFPQVKKGDVYALAGKKLGCFCKPCACHGDVLADYLNGWDDGD